MQGIITSSSMQRPLGGRDPVILGWVEPGRTSEGREFVTQVHGSMTAGGSEPVRHLGPSADHPCYLPAQCTMRMLFGHASSCCLSC